MSKCCICGKEIIGFGNNPWPIKDSGCCCDECNSTVVIQARLSKRRSAEHELEHCPFCGNTNITGATHKQVGSAEFYEVLCVECGARIRRSSKRKAIEAWNRRHNNGC